MEKDLSCAEKAHTHANLPTTARPFAPISSQLSLRFPKVFAILFLRFGQFWPRNWLFFSYFSVISIHFRPFLRRKPVEKGLKTIDRHFIDQAQIRYRQYHQISRFRVFGQKFTILTYFTLLPPSGSLCISGTLG